ncbi:MAG: hypothetical protein M5U15_03450 [Kiritimatiellae bacterium]|nr:hypothetical protein [Kiritimatiellia bacterium]
MRLIYTLTAALALASASAYADFNSNLKAAYFFDGNAGDSSGKGQDAQLVGASFTTDRNGVENGALLLDGNGAYGVTPVNGKEFPLSFSLWFRLDAKPGARPYSTLDSGIGEAFGHAFVIGSGPNTHNANLVSNYTFRRGKWTHIAVTYGPKLKVYMDGELRAERDFDEGEDFVAGNFQIGRHFDSEDARYFEGALDDILIFGRTLDDEEVRQLYEESSVVEQHIRLAAQAKASLASRDTIEASSDGALTDTPRPILVVASSSAEPNTNAWQVFDNDDATLWTGADDQPGWWLAAEFAPPLELDALEVNGPDGPLTNAIVLTSDDAEDWVEFSDTPTSARFLLITLPESANGAAPSISEIRWNTD